LYEEAVLEYEMVIALNRNWVLVIAALGWCKFLTGSIDEALLLHEQAIRLSPRDPGIGNWYDRIGRIHLLQSRTNEAIRWLEKARGANPAHPGIRIDLAAAYALEDKFPLAAAELAEARRLSGGHRFSSISHLKTHPGAWGGVPEIRASFLVSSRALDFINGEFRWTSRRAPVEVSQMVRGDPVIDTAQRRQSYRADQVDGFASIMPQRIFCGIVFGSDIRSLFT
jgi:tetratricopeptide (TPR) repeat protein